MRYAQIYISGTKKVVSRDKTSKEISCKITSSSWLLEWWSNESSTILKLIIWPLLSQSALGRAITIKYPSDIPYYSRQTLRFKSCFLQKIGLRTNPCPRDYGYHQKTKCSISLHSTIHIYIAKLSISMQKPLM